MAKRPAPLAQFKTDYTHGAEDAASVVRQWLTCGFAEAACNIRLTLDQWTDEQAADEILALWKFKQAPARADLVSAMVRFREQHK